MSIEQHRFTNVTVDRMVALYFRSDDVFVGLSPVVDGGGTVTHYEWVNGNTMT